MHKGILNISINTPIGIVIFPRAKARFKICPTAVIPIAIKFAGSRNHITDNEYSVEVKITTATRNKSSKYCSFFMLAYLSS